MHPLSWLYQQAMRDVGTVGAPSIDDDISKRQSWLRRVSQAFHFRLERTGHDVGVVLPPTSRPASKLSGHVPQVVVPHGWTREDDIREELLALSELVALRKVG